MIFLKIKAPLSATSNNVNSLAQVLIIQDNCGEDRWSHDPGHKVVEKLYKRHTVNIITVWHHVESTGRHPFTEIQITKVTQCRNTPLIKKKT